jgi:2',3'-cyclic-nucleotide 2'-phosphodiesterase (5'-nucleotidase family)
VAIPPGPIAAADLRNLIPHASKVVTVTLTGAEIRTILEQSVNNVLTDDPQQKVGGMIQVSGLRFRYDPRAPPFRRVHEVSVSGAPLAPDRRYRVATNSLLAEGGHRYRPLRDGRDRHEHESQYEIVRAWITRQGAVSAPPADRIAQSPVPGGHASVQ